ncbi:hypothetical protein A8709_05545 [Paenibacillus pectinilyticus]|uniref:DUF4025 domain-containing protein n=1 Tax=Paenibacillus pectinilyticus TaxID=512399 RepID=A0A1C0ZSU0_9BACL|nr:hypothetical protein [Paenibacillus pectinilyticus]OCT11149.1 hypothetical protein A8709_05545 [Paenibacillus pectinilyticus]
MASESNLSQDTGNEGKDDYFMDIDRMINEGLGGGNVTIHNGLIDHSTTDTMDHPESVLDGQ